MSLLRERRERELRKRFEPEYLVQHGTSIAKPQNWDTILLI